MAAKARLTTDMADGLAREFAAANGIDLALECGISPWASLEAHLNPPSLHGNHPEAAVIRMLAAKWSRFLRSLGYSR